MEIILLVGISGSGKSTWKKNFLAKNHNYLCVNRDTIRLGLVGNLDGYYQRKDLNDLEQIVTETVDRVIESADNNDYNLVIDNTNLSMKYINAFTHRAGVSFKFKLFDINPAIAKGRVVLRDFLDTTFAEVSDEVIQNFLDKVSYIDKQFVQYEEIKKQLLEKHKDKIINE